MKFPIKIAENYSVIVIPKDRAKIRRWSISRERILGSLAFVAGFAIFVLAIGLGMVHYRRAYFATADLRNRGEAYAKERGQLVARVDELESVVNQNEQLVGKLETIVGFHPASGAQVGFNGEGGFGRPSGFKLASLDPNSNKSLQPADLFDETTLRAYNTKTLDLIQEAKGVGTRLEDVYHFNADAEYFWTAVPTVPPVRGWVTSDFGVRRSPLSGHRQLHEGIDIASAYGSPVAASGDGVVTFAGRGGGLGKKIVVDHGYGLATVYGHNSEIVVREGDRVTRGQLIARVGSTGRSTGPHLHYEVHINGVPVDPRRFLLGQE